eukprot:gene8586-6026_t
MCFLSSKRVSEAPGAAVGGASPPYSIWATFSFLLRFMWLRGERLAAAVSGSTRATEVVPNTFFLFCSFCFWRPGMLPCRLVASPTTTSRCPPLRRSDVTRPMRRGCGTPARHPGGAVRGTGVGAVDQCPHLSVTPKCAPSHGLFRTVPLLETLLAEWSLLPSPLPLPSAVLLCFLRSCVLRSVRLLRGPRLPSSSSPPSSRLAFQMPSPNSATDSSIVFESDSNSGYRIPRRRPRQVIYIYDDDESYSKALEPSHPEQLNNGPTTVVRCHQEKKAVSPLNPRIGLPGPIALFGFGSTAVLVNLAAAGLCDHNAFMDCTSIFEGGLVPFVCGYFELVNKNTVGCIICTGYGAYNLINGVANVLPASTGVITDNFMGGFFCVWMFFTLTVFLMCVKDPITGSVLNFMVVLNFLCNAAGNWATNTALLHFAGYEGIVLGSVAIYMGMAFSLSAAHGHNVLPLGFHDNFRNFRW